MILIGQPLSTTNNRAGITTRDSHAVNTPQDRCSGGEVLNPCRSPLLRNVLLIVLLSRSMAAACRMAVFGPATSRRHLLGSCLDWTLRIQSDSGLLAC